MDWLAGLYVNILNLIQYMHDKYYYESCRNGTDRYRCAPNLCDRHCRLLPCRRLPEQQSNTPRLRPFVMKTALVVDYEIEGDFPRYGNDDDRADDIAVWLLKTFYGEDQEASHLS